ncbi:MAG: alpha/beta hydrolase [Acidobacteriota bacterium]
MPAASLVLLLAVAGGVGCAGSQGVAQLARHTVDADGHLLALWEKRPESPVGTILLLHGRTWSSLPDFDLQVPGENRSLMDALVTRGYAIYALDLRGYGSSPRDASGWNTPERAAADVARAIDWVSHNAEVGGRPALFGWSYGSAVAQLAAQQFPEEISALILFGYWVDPDVELPTIADPETPERRPNTPEAAASDFITPGAITQRAIDAYVEAALAADPIGVDWWRTYQFNALDPALVKVPTLLIQGEHDPYAKTDAHARFFARLGTSDRQWVVIPGGDHAALLEDTMPAFVAAMVGFLERPRLQTVTGHSPP